MLLLRASPVNTSAAGDIPSRQLTDSPAGCCWPAAKFITSLRITCDASCARRRSTIIGRKNYTRFRDVDQRFLTPRHVYFFCLSAIQTEVDVLLKCSFQDQTSFSEIPSWQFLYDLLRRRNITYCNGSFRPTFYHSNRALTPPEIIQTLHQLNHFFFQPVLYL